MKITFSTIQVSLLVLLLLGAGCTKNFKDYNTNPHQATDEQMQQDNLSTGSFFVQMQKNVFPIAQQPDFGDEVYQTSQNLVGDIYSGYMGATNNWYSGSNNTTYDLIPQWYGQAFSRAFLGIMPGWKAIRKVTETEAPQVYAMATIVKVEAMHRATDTYGPLPYLNFGNGALQNKYDSQKDIYYKFFDELDEAIAILTDFNTRNPTATALDKYDFIYKGNIRSWIKFANSLKLRLAIRIAYVEPAKAKEEAESAVNHPIGVMTDAADIAQLQHSSGLSYNHPLYIISENFDDIRMGANMESFLTGYNDPRLPKYFNAASDGLYHGIRNGITITNKADYAEGPFSKVNISATAPIVWMNPAEVYFLRAEGALRQWNMGSDAQTLYESGIRTSFAVNGVTANAADYYSNSTAIPAAYADSKRAGNNIASPNPTLLSTITIKWDVTATTEKNLERIITQKWIAMFPDGQEAWSEFRRTGYPKVFPVVVNNSKGLINTTLQIRRLPFAATEYQTNPAGVTDAAALLGGADNGGTPLWWDRN
ncbi:SusD/RagB family nutrient-binding outer membrane lipoprotein [Chitinophaga sp. SYP-B3965]|uniref:RagB/SusD family nutrient uptake outer membrane protein n=1 Tax=Chitinophaga sp. SYP-B3965 TaxID=2663120 RepID=UPI001299B800|nr:RagB/SusD family nutrient uptake outer membrane protein [Chitinophaga sp. SYP-B3965]MRG48317.1 SusD/RagB family nutrient-binding outer membrane lipoprotein [Chitinophaga sp. SYP-B3965]